MSEAKEELLALLEGHYRSSGWRPERVSDGTIRADGLGGVTWIGLAVVAEDLDEDSFEERLVELANLRMPQGQRCPLELLPADDCAPRLRDVLDRLRLRERGHVEVYSLAA